MKILICDDHELFRSGLAHVLVDLDPAAELVQAATGKEAIARVAEHSNLELALIDFTLPDMDGLELLHTLRNDFASLPVVMISGSEEPALVRAALDGGASGFIPKTAKSSVLLGALRLVLEGEIYVPRLALEATQAPPKPEPRARKRERSVLTPRQREVAQLIVRGLTNREISNVLGVAAGTIKTHVAAILEALDASNRTEAVMVLRELGLDEDPDTPAKG